jgi:hypothetical protein
MEGMEIFTVKLQPIHTAVDPLLIHHAQLLRKEDVRKNAGKNGKQH